MNERRLPPPTRPGVVDLLQTTDEHPADPDWRADALGRSRHSRLADTMREPVADHDPQRAEIVCGEIARAVLGEFAPALLLLSATNRRRAQTLTAWSRTLFDLASRPGLAGLDGDRLAQINAWEFQTEEALTGNPPGQPVFVAMAREEERQAWSRPALERVTAAARGLAVDKSRGPNAGTASEAIRPAAPALLELLIGDEEEEAATALAPLLGAAAGGKMATVDVSRAPRGWRRAASYVRRVLAARGRSQRTGIGLGRRLALLALATARPR